MYVMLLGLAWASGCHDYVNADPSDEIVLPPEHCIETILSSWKAEFPGSVDVLTIGESYLGRPISMLRVTQNAHLASSWDRPAVLVNVAIHGNENGAVKTGLQSVRYILDNPGVSFASAGDESLASLLAEAQLFVVPVLNVDGYAGFYYQDGGDNTNHRFCDDRVCVAEGRWKRSRRNGRPVEGVDSVTGFPLFDGVDLNRNLPVGWNSNTLKGIFDDGSGSVPTSNNWPNNEGAHALSEPETRALVRAIELVRPSIFVDVHGHRTTIDPTQACPFPLDARAYPNGQENWSAVSLAAEEWTWTGTGYGTPVGAPTAGEGFTHLTWRGDSQSLAMVMENCVGCSSPHQRFYSPYSPVYACNSANQIDEITAGRSTSPNRSGEAYGSALAIGGGVSLRLEVLDEQLDSSTPKWFDPGGGKWWQETEGDARDAALDFVPALATMLYYSGNPVPTYSRNEVGAAGTRTNAAIVRLGSDDGGCMTHQSFPAAMDNKAALVGPDLGRFGERTYTCAVTNWGDGVTGVVDVDVQVFDGTVATTSTVNGAWTSLAPGETVTLSHTYTFEQDHEYSVSCEVISASDTDASVLTLRGDPSCVASNDAAPYCNSSGDTEYGLNDLALQTFVAELDPQTLCVDGEPLAVDPSGRLVSFLPASAL